MTTSPRGPSLPPPSPPRPGSSPARRASRGCRKPSTERTGGAHHPLRCLGEECFCRRTSEADPGNGASGQSNRSLGEPHNDVPPCVTNPKSPKRRFTPRLQQQLALRLCEQRPTAFTDLADELLCLQLTSLTAEHLQGVPWIWDSDLGSQAQRRASHDLDNMSFHKSVRDAPCCSALCSDRKYSLQTGSLGPTWTASRSTFKSMRS